VKGGSPRRGFHLSGKALRGILDLSDRGRKKGYRLIGGDSSHQTEGKKRDRRPRGFIGTISKKGRRARRCREKNFRTSEASTRKGEKMSRPSISLGEEEKGSCKTSIIFRVGGPVAWVCEVNPGKGERRQSAQGGGGWGGWSRVPYGAGLRLQRRKSICSSYETHVFLEIERWEKKKVAGCPETRQRPIIPESQRGGRKFAKERKTFTIPFP